LSRSKHWRGTTDPKPKPRYSDEELEKLIRVAGGDVEEYNALREEMAPSGFQSLAFRRRVIAEAAALVLSVEVKDIWSVLYKAWVELQTFERFEMQLVARNRAQMKRSKSK
jgi:hypothetical protein